MSIEMILAPLFVQVALTFVLLFWMGAMRFGSVRRGETRVKNIALGEPNWPPGIQKVSNCFHNQFQLPVLFYVLVILAYELHRADYPFMILAWAFVILRIVHAIIHTGSNRVGRRFGAFAAGAIVLLAMWLMFALRVLLG
jgi:hypothetical protein